MTVKPAGSKPPSLAKGLPVTLEFPGKTVQTVSVGDVKAALQAKFSRVSPLLSLSILLSHGLDSDEFYTFCTYH